MTIKKFVVAALAGVAVISGLAASGVKESAEWWTITKPFFYVFLISITLAAIIYHFNYVRRVMYPALVCVSAWLYKYKILMTKFTRDTYRVYKLNSKSYKKLFGYTQDLFDSMYM